MAITKKQSIKRCLMNDVLAFATKNYSEKRDDAIDQFWGDFDPEDYLKGDILKMTEINFWEWVIFDWRPLKNKKSTIDNYIKAKTNLPQNEISILQLMNEAVISFYEVQEIYPDKGLLLKDLIIDGEYKISEKAFAHGFTKGAVLAVRILQISGKNILSGCLYSYQSVHKENILGMIKEDYQDKKIKHPRLTIKRYLKENSAIFNHYWNKLILDQVRKSAISHE